MASREVKVGGEVEGLLLGVESVGELESDGGVVGGDG